tara:strand:- start:5868 stop:6392 length:525 start_codon:yes stop_codon:yes gene_type:complete
MDKFKKDMGLGFRFNSLNVAMSGRRKQEHLNLHGDKTTAEVKAPLPEKRKEQVDARILPVVKAYQAAAAEAGVHVSVFSSHDSQKITVDLKSQDQVLYSVRVTDAGFNVELPGFDYPVNRTLSCEGAVREFGRLLADKDRAFLDRFKAECLSTAGDDNASSQPQKSAKAQTLKA